MKIRLNLDAQRLTAKPAEFNPALRTRLCNAKSITEITPEQLIAAIEQGRTFTPAVMTGTTGDTWQSQQLICADIDNDTGTKDADGRHIMIANPLTPEGAIRAAQAHGILPFFMYYSFSNSETWPKFRIVFVLDQPITDPDTASDLSERITEIFNAAAPHCADKTNKDLARIYYGGKPGSAFFIGGEATPTAALLALPKKEPAPAQQPAGWTAQPRQTPKGARLAELERIFEQDKQTFDLAAYVQATTTSRAKPYRGGAFFDPCPICGHNGCLQITGSVYHCHSDADGTGGSVIDWLMHADRLDKPAAMDKAKFELFGYDRDEWRRAWIEDQREMRQEATERPQSDFNAEGYAADTPPQAERAENATERRENTGAGMVDAFLSEIKTRKYEPIPTGITDIDRALGGGIMRQWLVLLGAAPGAGKTALAQWMFEGMAKRGTACLYLNLEMSRNQMLARSISRIAAANGDKVKPTDILQGYKWTIEQEDAVLSAAEEYKREIAPHLTYNPESVTANLDSIMTYITKEAERAEAAGLPAPICVLDYLQIVQGNPHEDDAAIIKRAVASLKKYAIEHNTIVFVIIAHNRPANKSGDVTMESGRDTSALEYSADLQLGLAFTKCLKRDGQPGKNKDDLTPEEKRFITLKITKGRFATPGAEVDLLFDGETMTYHQIEKNHAPQKADWITAPRQRI